MSQIPEVLVDADRQPPSAESLISTLRNLENWNHDRQMSCGADAGTAYEHQDYAEGKRLAALAELHEVASHAIERALSQSSSAPSTALIAEAEALLKEFVKTLMREDATEAPEIVQDEGVVRFIAAAPRLVRQLLAALKERTDGR